MPLLERSPSPADIVAVAFLAGFLTVGVSGTVLLELIALFKTLGGDQ